MTGLLQMFTGISWKWIGIGLAALAIAGVIGSGYFYVKGLSDDLAAKTAELKREQILHNLAELRANSIKQQHDDAVQRIATLESARAKVEQENTQLIFQVENLLTQKDFNNDKTKAVSDFAAFDVQLNRMLESVSRGTAAVRSPGAN